MIFQIDATKKYAILTFLIYCQMGEKFVFGKQFLLYVKEYMCQHLHIILTKSEGRFSVGINFRLGEPWTVEKHWVQIQIERDEMSNFRKTWFFFHFSV